MKIGTKVRTKYEHSETGVLAAAVAREDAEYAARQAKIEGFYTLGKSHAMEALDQNAVDDYRDNLYDTLREMGVDQDIDAVYPAERGFEDQIAKADGNA